MASRVSSQVVKDATASSAGLVAEEKPVGGSEKPKKNWSRSFTSRIQAVAVTLAFLLACYNLIGTLFSLICGVLFLLATGSIVAKLACRNKGTDYSNFDSIIEEVASKVRSEAEDKTHLKTPLLEAQGGAPSHRVYQMEDKRFGITDKKTGDSFLDSSSTQCVLRLTFSESSQKTGWFIEGSRTTQNMHQFTIKKGFASASYKSAYWEEESEQGTRRVVSGQFDSTFEAFHGEWLSSDNTRGSLGVLKANDVVEVEYALPV